MSRTKRVPVSPPNAFTNLPQNTSGNWSNIIEARTPILMEAVRRPKKTLSNLFLLPFERVKIPRKRLTTTTRSERSRERDTQRL